MKQIELDGERYALPETWEDIDAGMLPGLIEQVYLVPESGRMYHEVIRLCLGISEKRWLKIQKKHFSPKLSESTRRKNAEVLQQLVSLLSWLWNEPMDRQPFEGISINGPLWLLPEPDFAAVSYGELTDLFILLHTYIASPDAGEDTLDSLVATACRPRRTPANYAGQPDWNGDHREPYNEFIVRGRVKGVANVPFETKLAVLLYVASTVKNVLNKYQVFESDPSMTTATAGASGQTEAYTGQGFIKNQHLLAEKGIFGNLKQTQQANAHEVLLFLEEHRADLMARQQAQTDTDQ